MNTQERAEHLDNIAEARAEAMTVEDLLRLETEIVALHKLAIRVGEGEVMLDNAVDLVYGITVDPKVIELVENR